MRFLFLFFVLLLGCLKTESKKKTPNSAARHTLSLTMNRIPLAGLDPFEVRVTLKNNGQLLNGKTLSLNIPKGDVSIVIDHGNGEYSFTVTPNETGEYPVNISYAEASLTRVAVVLDTNIPGSGQPIAIPGDYVNSEGYEDGATITPDGEYLFVQYGPLYFSGILNFASICNSGSYSAGYDLNTCDGRSDSSLVFSTIGPYNNQQRPDFPMENIVDGKLLHLDGLVLPGVFNGIVSFPTVFYGFKRQSDGTFAQPFKISFNDDKGVNGPFGPSFILNGDGTAKFIIAWNNYFDGNADGGSDPGEDDKPDIHHGHLILGQNNSLGDVSFTTNDAFSSITPSIYPVGFSTHTGVQGNPHAFLNESGQVESIWTDDEQVTHDLSVYRLTSGAFPDGVWIKEVLPTDISTGAEENQPFFDGNKLYLRRGSNIVYHDYTPINGACSSTYTHNDCWAEETVVIGANGNTGIGQIFAVGEPTIATRDGKKYLYFVYVLRRENSSVSLMDWNINVGYVEIP